MRKLLLTVALLAGTFTLMGDVTPVKAQGAGGDVATPRRSAPRMGVDKRDDSMNAGRSRGMRHMRHKRHKMHRKMRHMKRRMMPGTTQGGSSSTPSMAPTGTAK